MASKKQPIVVRIIAIPLTVLFYIAFAFILLFFHAVQLITFYLGGYQPHKKSVDLLNFFMMNTPRLLGSEIRIKGLHHLPETRTIIIVSNHQSMMDIPPIIWLLRKYHVKFIAKKELSNWVPSISFNLKKGGSLLIDRSKGTETIRQITDYSSKLRAKKYSICIFPEGTRTRNGQMKEFKPGGLQAIVNACPDTLIVPFVVHDNFKLFQTGMFPLQIGHPLRYEILEPINTSDIKNESVAQFVQAKIQNALAQ